MRLNDQSGKGLGPMFLRRGRNARGVNAVGNLRLHDTPEPTDTIPFPTRERPMPRLVGRDEPQGADRRHPAEEAIDRMSRQLANLRALLGDDLSGPAGPRAA